MVFFRLSLGWRPQIHEQLGVSPLGPPRSELPASVNPEFLRPLEFRRVQGWVGWLEAFSFIQVKPLLAAQPTAASTCELLRFSRLSVCKVWVGLFTLRSEACDCYKASVEKGLKPLRLGRFWEAGPSLSCLIRTGPWVCCTTLARRTQAKWWYLFRLPQYRF